MHPTVAAPLHSTAIAPGDRSYTGLNVRFLSEFVAAVQEFNKVGPDANTLGIYFRQHPVFKKSLDAISNDGFQQTLWEVLCDLQQRHANSVSEERILKYTVAKFQDACTHVKSVMQHIEQDAAQLKGHGENVKATNGLVMDKAQLQQYLSGLLPLLRQIAPMLIEHNDALQKDHKLIEEHLVQQKATAIDVYLQKLHGLDPIKHLNQTTDHCKTLGEAYKDEKMIERFRTSASKAYHAAHVPSSSNGQTGGKASCI